MGVSSFDRSLVRFFDVGLSVRPLIRNFVRSLVRMSVHPFVRSFVIRLFVRSSVRLSVYAPLHQSLGHPPSTLSLIRRPP